MNSSDSRERQSWLRPVLSVITTLSITILAYAAVYNLGRPRNPHPDPLLAARLLPLEVLLGVVAGVLAYRSFGRQLSGVQRPDAEERMVIRLALRRRGRFTLAELVEASPLTGVQAQQVTARMVDAARLSLDGGVYCLETSGVQNARSG